MRVTDTFDKMRGRVREAWRRWLARRCEAVGLVVFRRQGVEAAFSVIQGLENYAASSGALADGRLHTRKLRRRIVSQVRLALGIFGWARVP